MPRTDPEHLAAEVLDLLTDEDDEELGLLERACRSTDVPALAEQHGLPDYWSSDMEDLCTVLQSWEERFGTRILALGQERLIVSVAAPASSMNEAEAIAAEHFAFSPDTITQGDHETLRAYAAHDVLGKQMWSFWWD
ncbi:DUF4253 domain-containing protein [Streptomyces sp. ME01-24h]|nr:DUF4253 domain-containing protein [Streptomyces sp. ME01-24h]